MRHPYAWLGWLAGGIFTVVGGGLLTMGVPDAVAAIQRYESLKQAFGVAKEGFFFAGMGVLVAGMGLLLLGMTLNLLMGGRPFRHAPANVLPGVPTLPLDTYTHSSIQPAGSRSVLHRWVERDGVLRLEPDPAARRRPMIGLVVLLVLLLTMWAILAFATPVGIEFQPFLFLNDHGFRLSRPDIFAIFAVLTVIPAGIIYWIISAFQQRARYAVSFDTLHGDWRIDREDDPAEGRIDDLAAIQICLHYQIVTDTLLWTFQLILVERDGGNGFRRHLLLEAEEPMGRIAQIGSQIAERLHLPFLHHATAAYRAQAKAEGRRRHAVQVHPARQTRERGLRDG